MGEAKRRKQAGENPQAAQAAVERDMKNAILGLSDLGVDTEIITARDSDRYGDGYGQIMAVHIGARDEMTAAKAMEYGAFWREVIAKHPKAYFIPTILGYDDDPRELWEFANVREYLRAWAQFAGITGPDSIKVDTGGLLVGLLAACGCDGFDHITPLYADGKPLKLTKEQ